MMLSEIFDRSPYLAGNDTNDTVGSCLYSVQCTCTVTVPRAVHGSCSTSQRQWSVARSQINMDWDIFTMLTLNQAVIIFSGVYFTSVQSSSGDDLEISG